MSEKLTPDQREKVNKLIDEATQGDLEGVLFNLVAELAAMTARAEHIGSTLAAVTAERDTLRRDHNGCGVWAEGARRERERLKAELAAMTASAQWYKDEWEKMRKAYAHECDPKIVDRLEAMTAERAIAERQVSALVGILSGGPDCPIGGNCEMHETCTDCWAAWSREQAMKETANAQE